MDITSSGLVISSSRMTCPSVLHLWGRARCLSPGPGHCPESLSPPRAPDTALLPPFCCFRHDVLPLARVLVIGPHLLPCPGGLCPCLRLPSSGIFHGLMNLDVGLLLRGGASSLVPRQDRLRSSGSEEPAGLRRARGVSALTFYGAIMKSLPRIPLPAWRLMYSVWRVETAIAGTACLSR